MLSDIFNNNLEAIVGSLTMYLLVSLDFISSVLTRF